MAKVGRRVRRSTRALIVELEPTVRRAWNRSVRDLADNVNFTALRRAIEAEDFDAVYEALNLEGSFEALERSLLRCFEAGGKMTTKIIAEEAAKRG